MAKAKEEVGIAYRVHVDHPKEGRKIVEVVAESGDEACAKAAKDNPGCFIRGCEA